jgi:hypothetical protein
MTGSEAITHLHQFAEGILDANFSLREMMEITRRALQDAALVRTHGNHTHAARLLQVHRNTFTRHIPAEERKARERFQPKERRVNKQGQPVALRQLGIERRKYVEHGVQIPARAD